jgi:hypothetical protein
MLKVSILRGLFFSLNATTSRPVASLTGRECGEKAVRKLTASLTKENCESTGGHISSEM